MLRLECKYIPWNNLKKKKIFQECIFFKFILGFDEHISLEYCEDLFLPGRQC